ncbi:hypothetical protein [Pantoea sp. M_9]|uniref:hypothetical protein n=1 Tax=Pantoea sp. M_9 TaxID=2608041 RepID=UPI001231A098|nr:hypothetical protein [Pantoea sp. M_9]KAA5970132.1 hypothetical protein F3I15_09430 [Pantoea sp. M_9]
MSVGSSAAQQLFHTPVSKSYLLPLFHWRYQVWAPAGVEGVRLTSPGWSGFTRAWIPPPALFTLALTQYHKAPHQER